MKLLPLSIMLAAVCASMMLDSCTKASADKPAWLEADSGKAIHSRLLYDFPWTVDQARPLFKERYPEISDAQIDSFINQKYIETLVVDDTLRVHRKALRNLALLNPRMSGTTGRGLDASPERIAQVDSVLAWYAGTNPEGLAHEITYTFSASVPYHEVLDGDSLHVWLPVPMPEGSVEYQGAVNILSASHPYVHSDEGATHTSLYMTAPAPAPGDTVRFSYTASFVAKGQFVHPDTIAAKIKPYDTDSELYRRYTSFEDPHIVRLDSLAHAIVGDETDPQRCSNLVFDFIQHNYPWAGAREYSTIDCIPTYVVEQGHGDCGQVSLLYISLMRSLGIPARWVSGWMLHPGSVNYHDWAGVYYEGVGWVPVDVSFGYCNNAENPLARDFYSHGMDSYRMSINGGVCGRFSPAKKFVRSETVDFQAGEIECSQGNMFYPAWDSDLEIISVTPVRL